MILSPNSGLASRSGETSEQVDLVGCAAPASSSRIVVFDALLIVSQRSPSRSAASIWLRISASSGEISSVGPSPCSRSRWVVRK